MALSQEDLNDFISLGFQSSPRYHQEQLSRANSIAAGLVKAATMADMRAGQSNSGPTTRALEQLADDLRDFAVRIRRDAENGKYPT